MNKITLARLVKGRALFKSTFGKAWRRAVPWALRVALIFVFSAACWAAVIGLIVIVAALKS